MRHEGYIGVFRPIRRGRKFRRREQLVQRARGKAIRQV